MGIRERRTRQKASLRRDILDAASRLFVQEGIDRVTMRKIAARIDYSPTTIYLHFKDKTELLGAVCDDTFAALATELAQNAGPPGTPLASLRQTLRTYVEFGLAHPAHYTMAFQKPHGAAEPSPFAVNAARFVLDALDRDIAACVQAGDMRTEDAELAAQTLWAGVHGVTAMLIAIEGVPLRPRAALIDSMVAMLTAGLQTPAAAAPSQPPVVRRPTPRPVPSRDFSFMD